ncbi:hypothetical protein MMC17_004590 [Xylographa soralifera]|nr:hypothetical protein [Xylographa soralifera]
MSASTSESDAWAQLLKKYWNARIPQLRAKGYSFQQALEMIIAVNEEATLRTPNIPPVPPHFNELAIQTLKEHRYPGAPTEDLESPTNTISVTQQENVIPPHVPSSIDQGTQCNIRTQEAEKYRQELKLAKLEKEKLKLLQLEGKQATSPKEAESIIQGLIRQRKEMKDDKNDELAILDLEYHLAQIQMDLGQYQNAETIARSAYDKRKELDVAGTSQVDLQRSRRQFCEALRGQKTKPKLKEAEIMYREVWDQHVLLSIPQEELSPVELRNWRLENGHNLGIVLSEEEKFRAAEDQHRDVMAERREILGNAHADTAQSAIEVIRSLLNQSNVANLPSKILELVEPIWQSSERARETSTLVLWCGHKLGETSYANAKFDEASEVLRDVWEARKKVGASDPSDAMSTAKLLALSLDAIGESQEADTVGDWVWETNQAHPNAGFVATPEEFQVHVCSLFRQKKFAEAALASKEEWKSCSKRHNESTLHESALNACYFYGVAVCQEQRTMTRDASSDITAVQDTYRLLPESKLSEISALKIYYLYAYMLYSMSNDVSGATNVLLKVWTTKDAVRLAQVPQRTAVGPAFAGVLECCYLWAHICTANGRHFKARELLHYGMVHAKKSPAIYKRFSDAKRSRVFGQAERYSPSFLWFL